MWIKWQKRTAGRFVGASKKDSCKLRVFSTIKGRRPAQKWQVTVFQLPKVANFDRTAFMENVIQVNAFGPKLLATTLPPAVAEDVGAALDTMVLLLPLVIHVECGQATSHAATTAHTTNTNLGLTQKFSRIFDAGPHNCTSSSAVCATSAVVSDTDVCDFVAAHPNKSPYNLACVARQSKQVQKNGDMLVNGDESDLTDDDHDNSTGKHKKNGDADNNNGNESSHESSDNACDDIDDDIDDDNDDDDEFNDSSIHSL